MCLVLQQIIEIVCDLERIKERKKKKKTRIYKQLLVVHLKKKETLRSSFKTDHLCNLTDLVWTIRRIVLHKYCANMLAMCFSIRFTSKLNKTIQSLSYIIYFPFLIMSLSIVFIRNLLFDLISIRRLFSSIIVFIFLNYTSFSCFFVVVVDIKISMSNDHS